VVMTFGAWLGFLRNIPAQPGGRMPWMENHAGDWT